VHAELFQERALAAPGTRGDHAELAGVQSIGPFLKRREVPGEPWCRSLRRVFVHRLDDGELRVDEVRQRGERGVWIRAVARLHRAPRALVDLLEVSDGAALDDPERLPHGRAGRVRFGHELRVGVDERHRRERVGELPDELRSTHGVEHLAHAELMGERLHADGHVLVRQRQHGAPHRGVARVVEALGRRETRACAVERPAGLVEEHRAEHRALLLVPPLPGLRGIAELADDLGCPRSRARGAHAMPRRAEVGAVETKRRPCALARLDAKRASVVEVARGELLEREVARERGHLPRVATPGDEAQQLRGVVGGFGAELVEGEQVHLAQQFVPLAGTAVGAVDERLGGVGGVVVEGLARMAGDEASQRRGLSDAGSAEQDDQGPTSPARLSALRGAAREHLARLAAGVVGEDPSAHIDASGHAAKVTAAAEQGLILGPLGLGLSCVDRGVALRVLERTAGSLDHEGEAL
jgi:hypothetical protein